MKSYTVDQIREMYKEFFKGKDHRALPSASLVPHDDPTLLLTVAGMVPFKRYFLGYEKPEHNRITTCQKCIRTPDIDNVGKTDRHGTFFEMLGNFSFGDYFKAEVIPWAWEFVTEHLAFPADKLWASVYLDDDEAYEIWESVVGLPKERIIRLGKEDNFWETGSGPCGPCSEIYIDRGEEFGCADPSCKPGCDCDRFIEFWNLVFIQFHQDGDSYTPLDNKSIDTGMGMERVAALLQGARSIFEIDNMRPIMDFVASLANTEYGANADHDISLRVVTDHLRATTFLISDGVLPSNEGRGYVLRRLLRRAVRHGRILGIESAFLTDGIDVVIAQMSKGYPELMERKDYIMKIVALEEQRFSETLDQGINLLEVLVRKANESKASILSGREAFKLYDTFGFPIELTKEIAAEHGLKVDEAEFQLAMNAQKERARASRSDHGYLGAHVDKYKVFVDRAQVKFVGYDESQVEARIVGLLNGDDVVESVAEGDRATLILDITPFYAESGGQVADQGTICGKGGSFQVRDVRRPVEGLVVHSGVVQQGQLKVGDQVTAAIESELRLEIARHHTATHLLHTALKRNVGEHVNQAGSYVSPERLRFDFTHFEALPKETLVQIEDEVNREILSNHPVSTVQTSIEEAKSMGAIALFGEKYGSNVRVVNVEGYSTELCGGTHVRATGDIGLFRIIGEGSVAAGVRRIEAVAGRHALQVIQERDQILLALSDKLQSKAEELPTQIDRLLEQLKTLEKELGSLKQQSAEGTVQELMDGMETINGVSLIVAEVDISEPDGLRVLGDKLKEKASPCAVLLGAKSEGKVLFLSVVSSELTKSGLHAGNVVKTAAKVCGGGGGGRPDMAQAGGRLPELLDQALKAGKEIFVKQLEGIKV